MTLRSGTRATSVLGLLLTFVSLCPLYAQVAVSNNLPTSDIYFASRDPISRVSLLMDTTPLEKGKTFVGIIGGLAALNFIGRLRPKQIELVDINPYQVEYGKCVVELVKISSGRSDFVSRFFSREFKNETDAAFLIKKGNPAILESSINKMPIGMREGCRKFFGKILTASYSIAKEALNIYKDRSCRYLKLRGHHGLTQGFNHLYYDKGWLASEETFSQTRQTLISAKISFTASDIADFMPRNLSSETIYFWGSNLDTFYEPAPQAYRRFIGKLHAKVAAKNIKARIYYLSTYRQPKWTDFMPFTKRGNGPHGDSSAKAYLHTKNKRVLELIPGPYGFRQELGTQTATRNASAPFMQVLGRDLQSGLNERFDVVLLHILYGSSFKWWKMDKLSEVKAIFHDAFERANKVMVLEHNPESLDFRTGNLKLLALEKIIEWIVQQRCSGSVSTLVEYAVGEKDNRRNMLISTECAPASR